MEPRTALRELERALPDTAMVSTDIGNICSVSNSYLRWAGIGGGGSRDPSRRLLLATALLPQVQQTQELLRGHGLW